MTEEVSLKIQSLVELVIGVIGGVQNIDGEMTLRASTKLDPEASASIKDILKKVFFCCFSYTCSTFIFTNQLSIKALLLFM